MTRARPLADRPRTQVRRRSRRVLAAITLVGALAVGATDVFLLTQGRTSTEVGLDRVLEDFREQTESAPTPTTTSAEPATPNAGSAEPTEATAGPSSTQDAGSDAPDAATADDGPASPATTSDDAAASGPATSEPAPDSRTSQPPAEPSAPELALPQPGVYAYATDGYETVSFGGGRHDYPETTYASVRHDGGCEYTVEHRWIEEHTEQHHKCNQGSDVLGIFTTAQVTFFGQTENTEVRCDPPVVALRLTDAPGTARQFTCDGGDTTTHETVTYLGEERLVIGGVEVLAKHVLAEGRVEGRSNGTTRHERWFHPEDGTVLRGIRHVETESQAFGTTVQYVEDVEYTLESLSPQR